MLSLEIVIRVLKTLWPFIIELVVGRHMTFLQAVKKHPWKTLASIIITFLIPWAFFATYKLYVVADLSNKQTKQIEQLSKEIKDLKKNTNVTVVKQASNIENVQKLEAEGREKTSDLTKQLEELRGIK